MLIYSLALILYFGLHSLLAAERTKQYLLTRTRLSRAAYRRAYNLLAIALLIGVMLIYWQQPTVAIWSSTAVTLALGVVVMLAGLVVIYGAMSNYDLEEFLGLRAPQHVAGLGELRIDGLNRYVRHPLYLGIFILLWGNLIRTGELRDLLLAAIGTLYLYVGSTWEEQKLVAAFGEAYRRYRQRVPRLLPRPGRHEPPTV